MHNEQPGKRLVGWRQYLWTGTDKAIFYTFASFAGGLSVVGLVFSMIGVAVAAYRMSIGNTDVIPDFLIGDLFLAGLCLKGIWTAKSWVEEANRIEPVALLTKAAAERLPEAETLVRGSLSPEIDPSAELLRVPTASCAPADNLLIASARNGYRETDRCGGCTGHPEGDRTAPG